MTDKLFTVAGVSSTSKDVGCTSYKVRFANDMGRIKRLLKKYSEATLIALPRAMTKPELVAFLRESELYQNPWYAVAIDAADEKYNGEAVVKTKVVKPVKPVKPAKAARSKGKPNMEALKARAVAKIMVEDNDTEEAAV